MIPHTPSEFEAARLHLLSVHGFRGRVRRFKDSEKRQTYCLERGQADTPTVLIHGGLSESSEWFRLASLLKGKVVLADRPGCGLSDPIDYSDRDYRADAVSWVGELVEDLGSEQVDVVANSMGGYFAMTYALAHPERVRRLVFVGAPAGLDKYIPLPLRIWGAPIAGRLFGAMIANTRSPETIRKRIFPTLVAHPERLPLGFLVLALAARKLPGAGRAARTMLHSVLTMRGWRSEMMMREELAQLEVPTLFLWGEQDAFAPPSSGEDMAARMPNAECQSISDAGHKPYLDKPDVVASSISDHLRH